MNQLQYLFQQRRQFCLCWWPSLLSTPSLMFPWPAWTPWNQCCRCHLGQKCWKSDKKIKDEILGGRSSGLPNDFQMEHFVKKTKQVADLVNKDRCLWSRHHHGIEADHLRRKHGKCKNMGNVKTKKSPRLVPWHLSIGAVAFEASIPLTNLNLAVVCVSFQVTWKERR